MSAIDTDFVKNRITQLRLQRNESERSISYALGHSASYIQSIASGRALPSIPELFSLCEYFEISLSEFFDERNRYPTNVLQIVEKAKTLDLNDISLLENMVDVMIERNNLKNDQK